MKKNGRSLIAFSLVLIMMLAMVPMTALAAATEITEFYELSYGAANQSISLNSSEEPFLPKTIIARSPGYYTVPLTWSIDGGATFSTASVDTFTYIAASADTTLYTFDVAIAPKITVTVGDDPAKTQAVITTNAPTAALDKISTTAFVEPTSNQGAIQYEVVYSDGVTTEYRNSIMGLGNSGLFTENGITYYMHTPGTYEITAIVPSDSTTYGTHSTYTATVNAVPALTPPAFAPTFPTAASLSIDPTGVTFSELTNVTWGSAIDFIATSRGIGSYWGALDLIIPTADTPSSVTIPVSGLNPSMSVHVINFNTDIGSPFMSIAATVSNGSFTFPLDAFLRSDGQAYFYISEGGARVPDPPNPVPDNETYKVTLENGGVGSAVKPNASDAGISKTVFEEGDTAYVHAGTRADATFAYWYVYVQNPSTQTVPTLSNDTDPIASFTMPANDVTVHAVWSDSYTVTLENEGVGATGEGPHGVESNVDIYSGTRSGYTFSHWTAEIESAQYPLDMLFPDLSLSAFSFVMPDTNVVLTAHWNPDNPDNPDPVNPTPSPDPGGDNVDITDGNPPLDGHTNPQTGIVIEPIIVSSNSNAYDIVRSAPIVRRDEDEDEVV